MQLSSKEKLRIILAGAFILIALVFLVLLTRFNSGIGAPGTKEDHGHAHTSEEKSQLEIREKDKLVEFTGKSIANTVASQLYAEHYKRGAKLEREAGLTEFKQSGGKSADISVRFEPSGDLISARITINNKATNDFDLDIKEAK